MYILVILPNIFLTEYFCFDYFLILLHYTPKIPNLVCFSKTTDIHSMYVFHENAGKKMVKIPTMIFLSLQICKSVGPKIVNMQGQLYFYVAITQFTTSWQTLCIYTALHHVNRPNINFIADLEQTSII